MEICNSAVLKIFLFIFCFTKLIKGDYLSIHWRPLSSIDTFKAFINPLEHKRPLSTHEKPISPDYRPISTRYLPKQVVSQSVSVPVCQYDHYIKVGPLIGLQDSLWVYNNCIPTSYIKVVTGDTGHSNKKVYILSSSLLL